MQTETYRQTVGESAKTMTEQEAYIALNMVQSIGAVTVSNGIARLGSAVKFFSAGSQQLASVSGIGKTHAEELAQAFALVDWRGEMDQAAKHQVRFLTPVDAAYPPLLKSIYNPPLALYVTGSSEALGYASLAIIGTRAPTTYGRANAKAFSYRLAQAGLTIVSGLARGIDTEAHLGALLAGGRTVAVVGSALDKLYPAENKELARRIVGNGGAVISEYPFGRQADKQTFPMRNRIISGLSSAVLVVEAGTASGTLITTDHALEQGRSVMAIPGRIDNASAQGCHKLIKDGARLVETPEEVLDEMQSLPAVSPLLHPVAQPEEKSDAKTVGTNAKPMLDEAEEKILSTLGTEEMTADTLVNLSGLSPSLVSPRLVSLEMKFQIERLPGNVLRKKRFK